MQDVDGSMCDFNEHLERSIIVVSGFSDIWWFFGFCIWFIEEIDESHNVHILLVIDVKVLH